METTHEAKEIKEVTTISNITEMPQTMLVVVAIININKWVIIIQTETTFVNIHIITKINNNSSRDTVVIAIIPTLVAATITIGIIKQNAVGFGVKSISTNQCICTFF